MPTPMDLRELLVSLNVLGVSVPSNPAGAMTPEQIISAIDSSLGNAWKQGLVNAIYVTDLREDSPDLAPYLDGGDGKWHIPANTAVILSLDGPESIVGRTIVADGNIWIVPASGSQSVTIIQDAGNIGDYIFENSDAGSDFYCGVNIYSVTGAKSVFNLTGLRFFTFSGDFLASLIPGSIAADYVIFPKPTQAIAWQDYLAIGTDCIRLEIQGLVTNLTFVECQKGFDLSSCYNLRLFVHDMPGTVAGEYLFKIGNDDGSIIGLITGGVGNIKLISSVSDSVFNANPLLSTNYFYDMVGFGRTARIGECYFSGDTEIEFSDPDLWTDLYAAAIGEGSLSNGIRMTENPGELEYTLSSPAFVKVSINFNGQSPASAGAPGYKIGAFINPQEDGYTQVTKSGYPVEQITSGNPDTYTFISSTLEYTIQMHQGDLFKTMIKNVDDATVFNLNNISIVAQVIS